MTSIKSSLKQVWLTIIAIIICIGIIPPNEVTAQDIVREHSTGLGNVGGGGGGEVGTGISNYRNWKQYEGDWAGKMYASNHKTHKFGSKPPKSGGSYIQGTVAKTGCYLVATAIVIRQSEAKVNFDPWDFIEHASKGGYMSNGDSGLDLLLGDVKGAVESFTGGNMTTDPDKWVNIHKDDQGNTLTKEQQLESIKTVLDAGLYPILRMEYNGGNTHFVVIDSISGDTVKMIDPGSSSTDLYEKYGDRTFTHVRPFEALGRDSALGEASHGQRTEVMDLARYQWDSGKIPGMPVPRDWEETVIPDIDLFNLEPENIDSVEKWKAEIQQTNRTSIIGVSRVLTITLGIGVILLSLVYLVIYVFDRVSILEFGVLEWVTRNKLAVSATGESTFFKGSHSYPKLINTRDMLVIQFLLIGVSVLILSGNIFGVIKWIMDLFLRLRDLIFS